MTLRTNSFNFISRYFYAPPKAQQITQIEPPPWTDEPTQISRDQEFRSSESMARQASDQAKKKFLAELPLRQEQCRFVNPLAGVMLNKNQTQKLIGKIGALLKPQLRDASILGILDELSEAIEQCEQPDLPSDLWAKMSLALQRLNTDLTEQCGTQFVPGSSVHFVQQNISNLEQVSRYAWTRLSQEALVQLFAREIEREVVGNPVLSDSEITRLTLEVKLPLPVLAGGGEISYQTTRAVDDEGNLVNTKTFSGGLTCKISALIASAKGKALGSYASYAFCRTAEDHARYFFKQLVEQNKHLEELSQYLSRTGAFGVDELSQSDQLQREYLLQQSHFSHMFSVLLDLVDQDPSRSDRPRGDHVEHTAVGKVNMQASAPKLIRMTKGSATAVSLVADGTVGALQLQAGLSGRSKNETRWSSRVSRLCEVLRHKYADAKGKARIKRQILRASSVFRQQVTAFWYQEPQAEHTTEEHIGCLMQDWQAYTRMHADHAQGRHTSGAVLDAFHKKYGARNTEDCLRRMALLVATLYIELQEQKASAENAKLQDVLFELELAMHNSSIPGARHFLAKHALAKQRINTGSYENFVQFIVGEPAPMGGAAPGVKITSRTVQHHNPLRAGDYVTVEFATGLNMAVNQRTMKAIADYFRLGATGLSKFFGASAYTNCGVHTIRFFRPTLLPGLPFAKQYERRTEQRSTQFGVSLPIPVPGLGTLQAGLYHSRTSSEFVFETPGTESILYFAMHYLHALGSGKTAMSGEKIQDSYWYRLEREQRPVLEKLFLNYARDARAGTARHPVRLIKELDVIERALTTTQGELQQCQAASSAFLTRALQLEQDRSSQNYEAALAEFKDLLRAYYPGWIKTREISKAYEEWQIPTI